MKKVYTVLVTYNADIEEVSNTIEKLQKQTDKIVVCNNSECDIFFDDDSIKVLNFGENLGIAQAQSIGMEWSFKNGADFVLQMDQDSIPDVDLVKELLNCYFELSESGYKVGLVGSQDFDKDTMKKSEPRLNKGKKTKNKNYLLVDSILSSGSLIPHSTYMKVGGMDDGLFIDAVDFEYCWRIYSFGLIVVKNKKALIAHKLGDGKKRILFFVDVGIPSPIRHYYAFRNTILLFRRSYVPNTWKIISFIKIMFKLIIYPFFLDNGVKRLRFMVMGIKDGLLCRDGVIKK